MGNRARVLPVADETMAQGCAETGAMQAVAKQSDIVSNGKGKFEIPRVLVLFQKRTINSPSRLRVGELMVLFQNEFV